MNKALRGVDTVRSREMDPTALAEVSALLESSMDSLFAEPLMRRSSEPWSASAQPVPVIAASGISWTGGDGKVPLRVALDFDNPGDEPTAPTTARLQVADFGAFRSWQPLSQVAVPSIAPLGRRTVVTTIDDEPSDPQTQRIDALRRALIAMPDDWRNLVLDRLGLADELGLEAGSVPELSPTRLRILYVRALKRLRNDLDQDVWDFGIAARLIGLGRGLRGEGDVHFVGNINVFVDEGVPVERHIRQRIGLAPGTPNRADFYVGDQSDSIYRLWVEAAESGWEVAMSGLQAEEGSQPAVEAMTEGFVRDFAIVRTHITPPDKAESGHVAIGVERVACGSTTAVEFDLETARGDAKCYFL